MSNRFGKLLLVALVPVVAYGAAKGVMHYNAKQTVDEMVQSAASHADVRYGSISTEVRGAVTVHDIEVQPLGTDHVVSIDAVRVSSSDPLFFIRSGEWRAGHDAPPDGLGFDVRGIRIPLDSALLQQVEGASESPCASGLNFDPPLLRQIGFTEMRMDFDGSYHLDRESRTLEFAINAGLQDIQSTQFSATLANVEPDGFGRATPNPDLSLARVSLGMRVSPEFGRRALAACARAADSEETLEVWGERMAEQAIAQLEMVGLVLGRGLREAVQSFYQEWGEMRLVLAPEEPVSPLALMLLPPERWAEALSLRLTINDRLVTDTSLRWEQPDAETMAALLGRGGDGQAETGAAAPRGPTRIVVRREFEPVRVGDIRRFLDHQVKIKPVGQPVREGVLRRVSDGQAEIEQSLHGGKFTAYVALREIESMQVLIEREVGRKP
jgi:hypothetical protein